MKQCVYWSYCSCKPFLSCRILLNDLRRYLVVENMKICYRFSLHRLDLFRRIYRPLISFFMFLGLLCGIFLAVNSDPFISSMMRTAPFGSVSIVGLFTVLFLPFLLAAFAVFISSTWLLFPLCFVRLLSFAYSAKIAILAFGDAGWLVRWLLMFSSAMLLPLFVWFCMRHGDGEKRENLWMDFAICAVLILVIGSLDYHIISPFLVGLID